MVSQGHQNDVARQGVGRKREGQRTGDGVGLIDHRLHQGRGRGSRNRQRQGSVAGAGGVGGAQGHCRGPRRRGRAGDQTRGAAHRQPGRQTRSPVTARRAGGGDRIGDGAADAHAGVLGAGDYRRRQADGQRQGGAPGSTGIDRTQGYRRGSGRRGRTRNHPRAAVDRQSRGQSCGSVTGGRIGCRDLVGEGVAGCSAHRRGAGDCGRSNRDGQRQGGVAGSGAVGRAQRHCGRSGRRGSPGDQARAAVQC